MSDNNIVDFPTTGNQEEKQEELPLEDKVDTSPEKLAEIARAGGVKVLELINKNRTEAIENLEKQAKLLDEQVKNAGLDVFVKTNDDGTIFNLTNSLRNILSSINSIVTGLEAQNSLTDMVIHDLGGTIQNLGNLQKNFFQMGAHVQVLLETLKRKGAISDDEMKAVWDEIMPAATQQVQEEIDKD